MRRVEMQPLAFAHFIVGHVGQFVETPSEWCRPAGRSCVAAPTPPCLSACRGWRRGMSRDRREQGCLARAETSPCSENGRDGRGPSASKMRCCATSLLVAEHPDRVLLEEIEHRDIPHLVSRKGMPLAWICGFATLAAAISGPRLQAAFGPVVARLVVRPGGVVCSRDDRLPPLGPEPGWERCADQAGPVCSPPSRSAGIPARSWSRLYSAAAAFDRRGRGDANQRDLSRRHISGARMTC